MNKLSFSHVAIIMNRLDRQGRLILDSSDGCSKLWVDFNDHSWIIFTYMATVTIFAIDLWRLRSLHPEDNK
jgi:hypothetical protein